VGPYAAQKEAKLCGRIFVEISHVMSEKEVKLCGRIFVEIHD
jgi:hypothetical protein